MAFTFVVMLIVFVVSRCDKVCAAPWSVHAAPWSVPIDDRDTWPVHTIMTRRDANADTGGRWFESLIFIEKEGAGKNQVKSN